MKKVKITESEEQPEAQQKVASLALIPTARGGIKRYDRASVEKIADELVAYMGDESRANVGTAKEKRVLVNRFFSERGITTKLVKELERDYSKFAKSLDLARQWQEVRLIEHGLDNTQGQSTVGLALKNLAGFAEKTESKSHEERVIRLELKLPKKEELKQPVDADAVVVEG